MKKLIKRIISPFLKKEVEKKEHFTSSQLFFAFKKLMHSKLIMSAIFNLCEKDPEFMLAFIKRVLSELKAVEKNNRHV